MSVVDQHVLKPGDVLYDLLGQPIPRSWTRLGDDGCAVCICGAVSNALPPDGRSAWLLEHRAAVDWEMRNGWRDADGNPTGPMRPPTT